MTIGSVRPFSNLIACANASVAGIGFPINIAHLHNLHRSRIESSKTDSKIWTNTSVVKLLQERPGVSGSRINGAIVRREAPNSQAASYYQVTAKTVVLATGGFQGSSSLTAQYLGQGADNVFVRSNKGSVGDGLNLAIRAGAATSRGMNTYYGHLMAAPLRADLVDPKDYLPLAQYREQHNYQILSILYRISDYPQKVNIAYSSTRPGIVLPTKPPVMRLLTNTLRNRRSDGGFWYSSMSS
jgi:hypothetical protein